MLTYEYVNFYKENHIERSAEAHFYLDDYWLRFREDKQERRKRKRGRRKKGRMEEEEQSDENHPTHSKLKREKARLKTQTPI